MDLKTLVKSDGPDGRRTLWTGWPQRILLISFFTNQYKKGDRDESRRC